MNPKDLLNKNHLKRTGIREGIISVMLNSSRPLSEDEIKNSLLTEYDRTTFYRSFKILLEKKIIHKIIPDNFNVKYALDLSVSEKKEHAHFFCEICNEVICLENIHPENPVLPTGYSVNHTEIIFKGVCEFCKSKNKL